jgi:glycosyltransferase involved in cell wall biosynthesis
VKLKKSKNPMRIAMVADPFISIPPKGYGGTERVIAMLAEGLVERNHEVAVFTTGDSTVKAPVKSFFVRAAWPGENFRREAHLTFSMQEIRKAGCFDLIHVHSAPACAMGSLVGLPLIFTSHWAASPGIRDVVRAVQEAETRFQLIAVSKRHGEILGSQYEPKVIYHGIDESTYSLGSGTRSYAAFLGRFMREKGVHNAVDAALQAGVPILLAGLPVYDCDHRYCAEEVNPRIRPGHAACVGELDDREKNVFLSHAIALLLPVDIEEAFGLVLVEAMMCGTPAIAYRRGAIPEIIDEGVTGWLVDTQEEMSERLRQLSQDTTFDHQRCRERAIERFSAARMVDEYISVYRRVVDADI